jgi:hypothetical protein
LANRQSQGDNRDCVPARDAIVNSSANSRSGMQLVPNTIAMSQNVPLQSDCLGFEFAGKAEDSGCNALNSRLRPVVSTCRGSHDFRELKIKRRLEALKGLVKCRLAPLLSGHNNPHEIIL